MTALLSMETTQHANGRSKPFARKNGNGSAGLGVKLFADGADKTAMLEL